MSHQKVSLLKSKDEKDRIGHGGKSTGHSRGHACERLEIDNMAFRELLKTVSAYPKELERLDLVFFNLEDLKKTRKALELALQETLAVPQMLNLFGQKIMAYGIFDIAKKIFLLLLDIEPGHSSGIDGMAQVYQKMGCLEKSRETWEISLEKFPDRTVAIRQYCQVLMALSDYDEAEKQYARLLEIRPNLPIGYIGLAQIYQQKEEYSNAARLWAEVVEKFPPTPHIVQQYCRVLMKLSQYDTAEKLFANLINTLPYHPAGYEGLARLLEECQDNERADAAWKRAVEKFPDRLQPVSHYCNFLMKYSRFEYVHRVISNYLKRSNFYPVPALTGNVFDGNRAVTPGLLEVYWKSLVKAGEFDDAVSIQQEIYHYRQQDRLVDTLFGEYSVIVPHFDNDLLGLGIV